METPFPELSDAPHLLALIRAGARFEHGTLVERETPETAHGTEVT